MLLAGGASLDGASRTAPYCRPKLNIELRNLCLGELSYVGMEVGTLQRGAWANTPGPAGVSDPAAR